MPPGKRSRPARTAGERPTFSESSGAPEPPSGSGPELSELYETPQTTSVGSFVFRPVRVKPIVWASPLKQPWPFLNHSPACAPTQCELADGRYGIVNVRVTVAMSAPGVVSPVTASVDDAL